MKNKNDIIKNKGLILIIIFSFSLIFSLVYVNFYASNIYVKGFKSTEKIEVFKKYKNSKITACYGTRIRCKKITYKIKGSVNTKRIGTYNVTYKIDYKDKHVSKIKKVTVVDTKKPELVIEGSFLNVCPNGKTSDVKISATDNYDGDIKNKVKIEGKVNTKRSGTYKLTYKVSDSSGNTCKKTRMVIVKDKTQSTIKSPEIKVLNGITYVEGILLVNKTYHLPKNYDPKVNKEALKKLRKMQADAKALGLNIPLVSGYRSYETQEKLYNKYVKKDGEKKANTYSAKPGESEHQTGLAFDIGSVDRSFANTIEAKWLAENAYLYGFIIRYPKGKTDITGYIYEPWHVRYLGEKKAKDVYLSGLTLEEYLGVN